MTSNGAGRRKARRRTAEQVRAEIDSGRTGDKVAGGDPSAVPLGTDDEAGGTSAGPEATAEHSPRTGKSPPYPPPVEQAPPRKSAPALWLIALGVAVVGLVAAMFAL